MLMKCHCDYKLLRFAIFSITQTLACLVCIDLMGERVKHYLTNQHDAILGRKYCILRDIRKFVVTKSMHEHERCNLTIAAKMPYWVNETVTNYQPGCVGRNSDQIRVLYHNETCI